MKKILFISHQSSITGGTILLLHLLKELNKSRPDISIDVLIRRNGSLVSEFKKLGNVVVLDNLSVYPNGFLKRIYWKICKELFERTYEAHIIQKTYDEYFCRGYDLIFSNTITNGDILRKLRNISCAKVTYIHELEYSIINYFEPQLVKSGLDESNCFIAVSNAVKNNLITNHNISSNRITVLKSYIPEPEELPDRHSIPLRLSEKGIDEETILIGVVGTSSWLKGIDLFIQIARLMKERRVELNYKFLWLGVDKNMIDYKNACYDMKQADIDDVIIFMETVTDPISIMSRMNIVLLPSREDSYPLVAIEAAMMSKPVIYFNNTGGISELFDEQAGIKVPYLALDKMVDAIVFLIQNPDERKSLGIRARDAYLSNHTRDFAYKHFESLIDSFISGSGLLKQ